MFDALILQPDSPWVEQIPAAAVYTSVPKLGTSFVGLDTWLQGDGWSIPFYVAKSTDKVQPLLYSASAWSNVASGAWKRSGNTPAVERAILASSSPVFPYKGNVYSSTSTLTWSLPSSFNFTTNPSGGVAATYRFSPSMVPAAATDGHMAVEQPDSSVIETYSTIVLSTGQVVALSYSRSHLQTAGDGWQNGQTASMLPIYAGIIDDAELLQGHIDHAMAVTVPPNLLKASISYPAYAFDRDAATANPPYSGSIPMGGHLAIPASVNLNAMTFATPEGKVIATAAQKYGFIVVDRGGSGVSLRVRHNSASSDPALHAYNWPLQYDLNQIIAKLALIKI